MEQVRTTADDAEELRQAYIPTRSSLLSRLRDLGDHSSWRDFFDTYWKLIYRTARRAGLTEAEAQDVVQETILTIVKGIESFKYDRSRGSFKGYLLQTTRWRILNHVSRNREPSCVVCGDRGGQERSPEIESIPDPASAAIDAIWTAEWEQNLMEAAMSRVKARARPKHFQAFELYALKQWSASKVAQSLAMSAAEVYLAKHRIAAQLKREIKELRAQEESPR